VNEGDMFFAYMFPEPGRITQAKVDVDEVSGQPIVEISLEEQGIPQLASTKLRQGTTELPGIQVNAGTRLRMKCLQGSMKEVWISFTYVR
jgi:hypothetical protein